MSTWRPENWMEGLFVNAHVFCQWRDDSELLSIGHIFAFVWDSPKNGVLVDFDDEKTITRYFVSFEQLKDTWSHNVFYLNDMQLVTVLPTADFKNPRWWGGDPVYWEKVHGKWRIVYC